MKIKGRVRERSNGNSEYPKTLGYDQNGKNNRTTKGGFTNEGIRLHSFGQAGYDTGQHILIERSLKTVYTRLRSWIDQEHSNYKTINYKN
ncbi:hypothetical protein [Paenibacillus polymyxa]|uniref:hypothetical protein n=1 Tax=Paenibacillus polymyxa TaxID=1406 RepID=UPI002AB5C5E1|nr:hypothetical protein [Paenibacillus polymyxa]MDY8025697.1 hypothetical protein [Paenibacillus polymyxa]